MKAVVYEAFGALPALQTVPEPAAAPDGAVIRVLASGVCRSDWHGWRGHDPDIALPHVPGHEFAGVVEAVGRDVTSLRPGERVTVPFVCGCGDCAECDSGNQQVCRRQTQPGFTHWGSFAEYVAVRHADVNLVRLPESIDFVTAASLGCRFVTSFRAVVDRAGVQPGEWVAVHGCGGVGLSAVMIAKALGARVAAIDISEAALALAADVGAEAGLNAHEEDDVVGALLEITDGGAHVSLDSLGSAATCMNSIRCLRRLGRHVQIGLLVGKDADPEIPMDRVIGYELSLFGSHGMAAQRYPAMFAMIEDGRLAPGRLVGRRIGLDDAADALTAMDRPGPAGVTVIDRF